MTSLSFRLNVVLCKQTEMCTFSQTIFLTTAFIATYLIGVEGECVENCGNALPRFRLLKLLDVQLDSSRRSQNLTKSVEDGFFSQFERDLEDAGNVGNVGYTPVRAERSGDGRQEEKVCTDTMEFLKELKSEISELKEIIVSQAITPGTQIFEADDLESACYPIGVDKHRLCRKAQPLNRDQKLNGTFPKSCKELLNRGNKVSGVYLIHPKGFEKPLSVLCDMETRGGGWIHVQKRFDGSEDFFRDWRDYKFGFGDFSGEFWLGLENTYKITNSAPKELLIELTDRDGKDYYMQYKTFEIGSEIDGYVLKTLSGFNGDLQDSLLYSIGSKFSTKDFERSGNTRSCAVKWSGAWWYKQCFNACLNGKYINTELPSDIKYAGIHWFSSKGDEYNYAKSRMMIRTLED